MLVFRVWGARQNFYVFSLYCNPDLMIKYLIVYLQQWQPCRQPGWNASFLFVGDLNGHHQEWLGSTTTNRHGVAALNFATVLDCDQVMIFPTHARGGTLDLLMTDFLTYSMDGCFSTTR